MPVNKPEAAAPGLTVNRALLGIIALLLIVIAAVSAVALKTRPLERSGIGSASAAAPPDARVWTGIGRVRCPLKAADGAVPAIVVLSVVFHYNHADAAFTRELARSNTAFRQETRALFAGLDAASPLLANEDALKNELLARYNKRIRLGVIEKLYFPDFTWID